MVGPRAPTTFQGPPGNRGSFRLAPCQEHVMSPSPASTAALIALARADTVLVWDPTDRTLIAANIVGRMPWTDRPQPAVLSVGVEVDPTDRASNPAQGP